MDCTILANCIAIRAPDGQVVESVTYSDAGDWDSAPDGLGPSLERLFLSGDASSPGQWSASINVGGTPGATNSLVAGLNDRIHERWTVSPSMHDLERFTFLKLTVCPRCSPVTLELASPEMQLKGIVIPSLWQHGVEMGHAVQYPEASEAFDDAHPSSRHACDVQALIGFVVVIVEVQACGAQVHLNGLVLHAQFGGEHHVDTRTQAALMDRSGLIKLKIFSVGCHIEFAFKKVQALQGVSLLDEHRPQDAVPAPMLVDRALLNQEDPQPSAGPCP